MSRDKHYGDKNEENHQVAWQPASTQTKRTALSPEAKELISKTETGLTRALRQVDIETRLVEELLDVSRLEMRKFDLALQRCNLVTVVQGVVVDQQQAARTHNIELVLPP